MGRKYTDDYGAKLEIWAGESKVRPIPRIANLPKFGSKKFRSHEEMNVWKKGLIEELMRNGGAKWESAVCEPRPVTTDRI